MAGNETPERFPSLAAKAGLAAGWAIAAAALALVSPLENLELRALDLAFNLLRPEPLPKGADRVVVVGIDTPTVESIREPVVLWHAHLAQYLEALAKAGPAVAALDVVLPDRSYETVAPELDRRLLRAFITTRRVFPTVLAITINEDRLPRKIHPAFITAVGTKPGYALWSVDVDGRIRRYEDDLGAYGEKVNTLVGEVARHLEIAPASGYIDYALGDGFDYVPFKDVLDAADRGDTAWLTHRFADKVVLLGTVLPFTDTTRVPAPIARWDVPETETPGVLVHAQAIRSMLAGRMIQRAPLYSVALLAFGLALLAIVASTPWRAALLGAAMVAGLAAASVTLLRNGHFVPVLWPAFAGLFAIGLRVGVEVVARLGERRKLRNSFSAYVSPAVMKKILAGQIRPEATGDQVFVCALFSDVRSYTTMSERMTPPQVLSFFNRYFDHMVEVVHKNRGAVVNFMGDGMMALFGAPEPLDNPCEAGYRAGLEMFSELERLNSQLAAEGLAPIAIGVGLHAGDAVVGHVGSRTRHDYTAIGDAINVASRLESATKEAGFGIVLSDDVVERLPDRAGLAPLGELALKGHTPVKAWGALPTAKSAPAPAKTTEAGPAAAVR